MWRSSILCFVFVLALAGRAHAILVPFVGTFHLQVRALAFEVTASGVAEVDSVPHPTRISIPSGVFEVQGLTVSVPTSIQASAFPVVALQVTLENDAGSFNRTASGFDGVMPLRGGAKVCLYAACASAVANVSVPLSVVGVGGDVQVDGLVDVSVIGAPWTTNDTVTGFRTVSSPFTVMGFRRGPAGETSSTALPSGVIQLVTPVFVSTNIPAEPTVATFASLRLHFVPEPASLLLFGLGIAGLCAMARSA